jgi:phage shock protein A
MASLFKAIGNMFREKRDQAANALADPIRDGKFAIEDSKKQIREYTTQVAKLKAETIKMKADHKDALSEKKKYENIAKKAGEAGNESDVRTAVEQIQKWTNRANELKGQIAKNETVETNLRKQLDAARTKVSRAEQNHQTLAARKKGAEIRKSLAQASAEFAEGQGGLAALDDLEDAVRQEEAEAEAFEDMSAASVETDLSEKYGSGNADADDMVAKFMSAGK